MTTLKATSIIGAGDKENRQDMDFYPTPKDVTIALMEFLELPRCTIWEPACGDGAISEIIIRYGHKVISSDIRNSGYGRPLVDFLKEDPISCDAIITNPPFNLAAKFILKSLKIAPTVAMVLKSQYWHAAKRQTLFNRHPPAFVMPLTWRPDFLGGGAPTMDVVWTVWLAGDTITKYRPLTKPTKQLSLF